MKNLVILMVMFLTVNTVYSQAFEAKNFNIDVGYALGSHRNAFYSPGVLLNLEKGVHKWIGVGAYTGYQYNFGGGIGLLGLTGYSYNAHSIPLGGTGAFHFYQMIGDLTGKDIKQDKLDVAIKHSFGVRFDIQMDGYSTFTPSFDWGTSVMARYFFNEHLGVYAEVGYPAMGNLVIGGAFKF